LPEARIDRSHKLTALVFPSKHLADGETPSVLVEELETMSVVVIPATFLIGDLWDGLESIRNFLPGVWGFGFFGLSGCIDQSLYSFV